MRARKFALVVCGALMAALCVSIPTVALAVPPAASATCDAVAHYEDAAHTGSSCSALVNPSLQWKSNLNGPVLSYPLIADGLVFVTTMPTGQTGPHFLYALHQTDGSVAWGPIPLLDGGWSLAYDNGELFTNGSNASIAAYNATTGAQLWVQMTTPFGGEVVAYQGVVYVKWVAVYALSESTGAILWTSGNLDGNGGEIAVDANGVYTAAGVHWYKLDASTGAVVWSGPSVGDGGGGGSTSVADGRVFANPAFINPVVVDETTGAKLGTFSGSPAFSGSTVYFTNTTSGGSVVAEDATTLTPIYTRYLPAPSPVSNAVIAGGVVYVAGGSSIFGVDATTGNVVVTQPLGAAFTGDIAVGDGLIAVPTGSTLTTFGSRPPGSYEPVTPTRVLDTRTGWPVTGPIPAHSTFRLIVGGGFPIGETTGVPLGAAAVVLNVTVTDATAAGNITIYPDGVSQPTASNLNFVAGQTVANVVVVALGPQNKIVLTNSSPGSVQLIADVSGYYFGNGTPSVPGTFRAIAPTRLLDTRHNTGSAGPVSAHGTVHLQVTGSVVPSGASAVVVNVTVTAPATAGNITVYPDLTTEPTASNLNFVSRQTIPNLVEVGIGSDGKIALTNNSPGTVQLIVDVSGYYVGGGVPTATGTYIPVTPTRMLDTRHDTGATGPVEPNSSVHLLLTGGLVPARTTAVVLNVTVTAPTSAGYVTAYPDLTAEPRSSNLNFVPGLTIPNLVVVGLGSDGRVTLTNNSTGTVQMIADVAGYYLG